MIEVFDGQDNLLSAHGLQPGDVFAFRCEGEELVAVDDSTARIPATHSARNAGTSRYREILVETKNAANSWLALRRMHREK